MSRALAATIALYALGLAAAAAMAAVRGRGPTRALVAAAGVLEAALGLQALVALRALAGGRRPHELSVWAIYLAVSLAIVPLGAWYAAGSDPEAGRRTDVLVLAVAAVGVVVVLRRMVATWGGA